MTRTYLQEAERMARNVNALTDKLKVGQMIMGVGAYVDLMDYNLSSENWKKLRAECAEFIALYGVWIEKYLDELYGNHHDGDGSLAYRDVGKRFHGSRNGSTSANHSFIQVAPKLHRAAQMFGHNAPPGRQG